MQQIRELLSAAHSIVIQAPRFYGKANLARQLASEFTTRKEKRYVELSSRLVLPSRDLDFGALWVSVKRQLGLSWNTDVTERFGFESAVYRAVIKSRTPLLFSLFGARRGNESNHAIMVSIFDLLLSQLAAGMPGQLCVMVEDDGSLRHEQNAIVLPSASAYFHEVRLLPLARNEVARYIGLSWGDEENAVVQRIAELIASRTGGHPGLISELLEALPTKDQAIKDPDDTQWLDVVLSASPILEALSSALEEDPEGFSHTALEYLEPRYPEARRPRIEVLTQLGILQRASPSTRLCLCKGAIASLVEDVARQQASVVRRIGTLVSDMGPRIFVAKEIQPEDDDLVVIHLSDIHVGNEYRHLLRSKTATKNLEQRSLGELLQEDLCSLSLAQRVDAVVLSGDIVSDATKWDQFLRAREVIQEMLAKANVPMERLLVIPGNHDVDWAPNELSNVESDRAVSWDNYRAFLELLGKPEHQDVAFLSLVSRSGRVKLRIVGLNSNHVEGPNTGGIGYVSGDSFQVAERILAADAKSESNEQIRTWLAVHHHLLPVTAASLDAAKARKVSVMGNAALVQSYANRWNVELVLHGHEHQPAITVARRWPVDAGINFSPLTVLAAGSVGAKVEFLGPFARNQYFLIYRRTGDTIVRSRCTGDAGVRFVTHNDIFIPQPVPRYPSNQPAP